MGGPRAGGVVPGWRRRRLVVAGVVLLRVKFLLRSYKNSLSLISSLGKSTISPHDDDWDSHIMQEYEH